MTAFAHPALFYRDSAEYLAGTVPFIADGLALGEPVAVAVPAPHLELLRAELGSAAAEVMLLDMTKAGRNPGRIIPGVLRAFADSHPGRVRIIGEPIWPGRSAAEYPACAQHEALINHAFAGRDATILCPYDSEGLAPEVLDDAFVTHPVVIDASGTGESAAYAPDRIVETYNVPLIAPPVAESLNTPEAGLAEIRRFVSKYALHAGLEATRTEDLVLVVDELAANTVRHGGGSGKISIWTETGNVICQVSDHGRRMSPLAGRIPAPLDQPGGRGLLMVNHLADLVRIHTTPAGTTIRAYFTLS
jgi:anti-sigma regulatory factor (Ser/Thr protein kinase)